jgi:16S rRNA (cytidine1402-2'-O)-methyltransferase
MGTLYLVATPIGNLEDISIRALKTLASVDGIACEDTRRTGMLLKLLREKYPDLYLQSPEHRASQRLLSYFEQNEQRRIPEIVTALKNGINIALVSDAGTPAISDPGFRLIRECLKEGISVTSVPGPSSVISALITSGLPTDKFLFLGYPPHKGGKRMQLYKSLKKSLSEVKSTVILFEAPHKLTKTLKEIQEVFGDIEITLARELTKVHEEVKSKPISEWLKVYKIRVPKGEFVFLFSGEVSNTKTGVNSLQE